MGGTTSKSTEIAAPSAAQSALSKAAYVPEYVAQQLQAETDAARLAAEQLAKSAQASASNAWLIAKSSFGFVLFAAFVVGLLYLIDFVSIKLNNTTVIGLLQPKAVQSQAPSDALYIDNALYGVDEGVNKNVTDFLNSKLSFDQKSLPSFKVDFTSVGLSEDPNPGTPNKLTVTWQIGNCSLKTNSAQDGENFPSLSKEVYGTGPDGKLICLN
jgi:hypothetical protein